MCDTCQNDMACDNDNCPGGLCIYDNCRTGMCDHDKLECTCPCVCDQQQPNTMNSIESIH